MDDTPARRAPPEPETAAKPGLDLGAPPAVPSGAYRVLARKYRPARFEELIGQEPMVRTLANAIASGRIAHAFILTGVRGVGKTTTARILARALNCVGPDGRGGPTIAPCGVCQPCTAIAESRHVDVLEMDAASRTGIDDIREIIDGVRYAPVSARYKVYVIDEVHMLSRAAFNGLLKTLEEPPAHVIFIFATTEIRKVPLTVLSRCQRFDLRRVEGAELAAHLGRIAAREGVEAEADALGLIARAAEGSVRDALSILDQALAYGGGRITRAQLRDMLGLADRQRVFDLFDALMRGDAKAAIEELAEQYAAGADPVLVLQDLLELTHWLSRIKVAPEAARDAAMPDDGGRAAETAARLSVPVLARIWQMLLKALNETQSAPQPLAAAEMALIRLAYAAELPDPAQLVRALLAENAPSGGPPPGPPPGPPMAGPQGQGSQDQGSQDQGAQDHGGHSAPNGGGGGGRAMMAVRSGGAAGAQALRQDETPPASVAVPKMAAPAGAAAEPMPADLAALSALAVAHGDRRLKLCIDTAVHLVRFDAAAGRIEFRPGATAPADLAQTLSERLQVWTGRRWVVAISNAPGAPSLAEQAAAREAAEKEALRRAPLVAEALRLFPEAEIVAVREIAAEPALPDRAQVAAELGWRAASDEDSPEDAVEDGGAFPDFEEEDMA